MRITNIGQVYSFSQNAGIIIFEGGPYDGQSGLFDCNCYDGIDFCDSNKKVNHEYVPVRKNCSWVYHYVGAYNWSKK